MDRCALAGNDHPVAFLKVGDALRQRSERQCIRPQEHLALAIAEYQRRAEPRADQQVGLLAKSNGQREGTAQAGQHGLHCIFGRGTLLDLAGDEVRNDLAVGFAFQHAPVRHQFFAQRTEVLDNPVMHQRNRGRRMRVGIIGGRCAVRSPTCMRNTDIAGRGFARQHLHEVGQLALCAAADQRSFIERADPGTVIAAVFHPLEAVDQTVRNRLATHDSDNAAHCFGSLGSICRGRGYPASPPGNPSCFG